MKLIYQGSVKNLYEADTPNELWFEYTDDYSVFDWGKMPDPLRGKGETLARLAEWFFRMLGDEAQWRQLGLEGEPAVRESLPIRHHFLERQDNRIRVVRLDVPPLPVVTVGGQPVYDYGFERRPTQLIPLEVIFRFGVPRGSSLLKRKDWYPFPIEEGAEFEEPLIEFSTKLESKDRMLAYQEAAHVAGGAATLARLHAGTHAVALFLRRLFERRGLKLWDGKLEWAWIDGKLALVDSIGPDELRVGLDGAVFSKQFLRDYYLDSDWYRAIGKARELARARGDTDWKTIAAGELKAAPERLSAPYREAAEALYDDFYRIVVDGEPSRRFRDALARLG